MSNRIRLRPILFSDPMVRAILSGQKTQTRRIIKPQGWRNITAGFERVNGSACFQRLGEGFPHVIHCPYGKDGDRLWVRETFRALDDGFDYRATSTAPAAVWTPSIYMPRQASRITLEITDIRAERLTEITTEDIYSEGFSSLDELVELWRSINEKPRDNGREPRLRWEDNPWVWVVSFRTLTEADPS